MSIFDGRPDLLRDFREGKRAALQALYWEYVDLVAAVVRRSLDRAAYDEQLDLIQETFVRAFDERARLAYNGLGNYRSYLMGICRNILVDALRKRGREVPVDLDQWEIAAPSEVSAEINLAWADPATIAVVQAYVEQLNPFLREFYELRYVRGASQTAVAEQMKISRQKVRTLEHRLRRGLEQALAKGLAQGS